MLMANASVKKNVVLLMLEFADRHCGGSSTMSLDCFSWSALTGSVHASTQLMHSNEKHEANKHSAPLPLRSKTR